MVKNVFEDIGFSIEESKDLTLRVQLVDAIIKIVKKYDYSQKELKILLNQPQSEISHILAGNVSRFSSDKLIKVLNLLDAQVALTVKIPKKRKLIAM